MTNEFCSLAAAQAGLPAIGTAGCFAAVLAFELRGPWASHLVGSRCGDAQLDDVLERIRRRRKDLRLLAIERDDDSRSELATVLFFECAGGPSAGFAQREYCVERGVLASLLEWLALGDDLDEARRRLCAEQFGQAVRQPSRGRHLMVCTHGGRDACCGTFGYRLYRQLVERRRDDAAEAWGGAAVWRCSHLGGHRFAPTLLELPSGRVFGRVTPALAAMLASGKAKGVDAELLLGYRGLSALPEAAQIVERELWRREGGAWLEAAIECRVEQVGGKCDGADDSAGAAKEEGCLGATRVAMVGRWPQARSVSVSVLVARAQTPLLIAPSCNKQLEPEAPFEIIAWEEGFREGR